MAAMARLQQCVICDSPTDQECLWCNQPLHRHDGHEGSADRVEFTECWTRHQTDCEGGGISGLDLPRGGAEQ